MTEARTVADAFHAILAHSASAPQSPAPAEAPDAIIDAVDVTILPRRIDVSAGSDARLSVVARNRRILSVVDAEPTGLWRGDAEKRDAGADGFAATLAESVVALSGYGPVTVETALVNDDLSSTALAEYPAARLRADIEALQASGTDEDEDGGSPLDAFHDAWSGHARARSSGEIVLDLPDGSPVEADWMRTLIAEWIGATDGDEPQLRFVTTGTKAPMAIAFAAVDGIRCVVVSCDSATFGPLEAGLATLRQKDREG